MILEARTRYLVLDDQIHSEVRSVRVTNSLSEAVANWTPGSRLSPIWLLKRYAADEKVFRGAQSLIFVGPVHPTELFSSIQALGKSTEISAWLTAGCFNLLLVISETPKGIALRKAVLEDVNARRIAHEFWALETGIIRESWSRTYPAGDAQPLIDKLAAEATQNSTAVLQTSLQENVVVTATSLSRAAAVYPPIFSTLHAAAEAVCATMENHRSNKIGVLEMQSRLLSMNAALSRFSSQAFSGIPPIERTECHFWIHSLLGTGAANIALANLVDAIQKILGEARLRERLAALEMKTDKVPDKLKLVSDTRLLEFDILQETENLEIKSPPIIPLITYFSGRDGFSSHLQTLSAPLTTIAECNSYRSNLLTVTHEISHIFVQSALSELSPSLNHDDEMEIARRVARPGFQASNHLEAARQLLVEAVISMEMARGAFPADEIDARLPQLFDGWRKEVQEILVHAFDFLYFHQGSAEFYVTSIWHSWCSIPGISDRVPEYLMRTLCAVSAKLLEASPAMRFDAAIASTKKLLETVQPNIDSASNYVDQALSIIKTLGENSEYHSKMEKEFSARLYLVRLVKIYLYSDLLSAKLFADPFSRSRSSADEKRRLSYSRAPIGNALTFLKEQLKSNPSDAESLWVLHCLAFDLRSSPQVSA
jgi:hypothetical protein